MRRRSILFRSAIILSVLNDLVFMPDGKTLVSTGINEVEFWSIEDGIRIAASKKHKGWSKSVALSTDGTKLASGDNKGLLRVWNTSSYLGPQKPVSKDTVQIIYFLLSQVSAEWLDKNRSFNPGQPFFNESATIEIAAPARSPSESTILQFHLTDADGLHQAMLLIHPTADTPPPGYQMGKNPSENKKYWRTEQKGKSFVLHDYRALNAEKEATIEFNLPEPSQNSVKLQLIDVHGNITFRTFNLKEISAKK